jgi:hypothetical protein
VIAQRTSASTAVSETVEEPTMRLAWGASYDQKLNQQSLRFSRRSLGQTKCVETRQEARKLNRRDRSSHKVNVLVSPVSHSLVPPF